MHPFDILVAGEINPDLILSGDVVPEFGQVEKLVDSAALTVGSSSVITACGAARLGLKVAFIGICGDDIFGRFLLEEMTERGVDISAVRLLPDRPTGLTVILNKGGDRAMLTNPGTIADLQAADVTDELLRRARHLHVASYFLQSALRPGLANLFRRARSFGLTTSLDTNWDPSGKWRGVRDLLSVTDIFLPNENEAVAITAASTVERALVDLVVQAGTVAVKCGPRGALARRGSEVASAPALKNTQIVDTVGAGDTFNAGFLYGFLNGWSLEKSLRMASVCGSLSARSVGGTSAQPTFLEAIHYVPSAG